MLSSMDNDIIREFDNHPVVQDIWNQLKTVYGVTYATRLCTVVVKFDTDLVDCKHTKAEHFRVMSAMIRDLQAADNNLSDDP